MIQKKGSRTVTNLPLQIDEGRGARRSEEDIASFKYYLPSSVNFVAIPNKYQMWKGAREDGTHR